MNAIVPFLTCRTLCTMIVGHLRGHPRVRAPWTPPGYASYARRFPALFPRSQGQRESSSPGAGARLHLTCAVQRRGHQDRFPASDRLLLSIAGSRFPRAPAQTAPSCHPRGLRRSGTSASNCTGPQACAKGNACASPQLRSDSCLPPDALGSERARPCSHAGACG